MPERANRLLGYPDDARLLIINADDFGMCHSVNAAIISALRAGVVTSTTLMTPCPWALQAMHHLAAHPEIPFGIHLTVIGDGLDYRWRPLSPRGDIPSLLDETGYFYNFDRMAQFFARVSLEQLESEFRAQIESALGAGLHPTHLDWHSLRLGGRQDIPALMFRLAREYGLALRVAGQAWIAEIRRRGLPANDYDFLDSYLLPPAEKPVRYVELLRTLPPGLSEWAVHPGLDNAELQAIEPGGSHYRQADLDFLISPHPLEIIRREGIILLDYRALQTVWKNIEIQDTKR